MRNIAFGAPVVFGKIPGGLHQDQASEGVVQAQESETSESLIAHIPEQIKEHGSQLWNNELFVDPQGDESKIVANRFRMSLNVISSTGDTTAHAQKIKRFHDTTGMDFSGMQTITKQLLAGGITDIPTNDFPISLKWETAENPGDPHSQNTALELWAANHIEDRVSGILSESEVSEAAHDLAVMIAAPNTFNQVVSFVKQLDTDPVWTEKAFPSVDEFRAGAFNREPDDPIHEVLPFLSQT